MIIYERQDWVNLFKERLSQYPTPDEKKFTLIDPYKNDYLLSDIDIERGKKNGCVTPDDFIDFLQVELEGWFFERQLSRICTNRISDEIKKNEGAEDKIMAIKRTLGIGKEEEKKLVKKWEKILRKEGMPAELPSHGECLIENPDLLANIDQEYEEPDEYLEKLVEEARGKLTERERKVFEMHVDLRMSYGEIAHLLKITPNAVKKNFKRAKNRLKEELKFLYE